ncbi:MAG: M48 family peptidase [Chloroflexi bacterium]|jgi:hypothetical protein|nr:M48 family peptidase [Chloroflexota bacterium]
MKLSTKAQASLNRVIEQFQSGDLSPLVEVARIRRHPDDHRPFDAWSFSNQVLAFIQTGSVDCRGYRQWQQAGRHVRKGERASYILGPRHTKITDEETGEEKLILTGFISIAVFADHQTEGEPLPEFDYQPEALPPLVEVATSLGIPVTYEPLPPDRLGQYTPKQDAIALGTHDPEAFFHELAHAIHYRVNPKVKPGRDKAGKETVAELTATVLMHLYGLGDRTGNCWSYIQSYASDPLVAITKALADIEQVLAFIEKQRPGSENGCPPSATAEPFQVTPVSAIQKGATQ